MTTELYHREIISESGMDGDLDHATTALENYSGSPHYVHISRKFWSTFKKGEDTLAVIPTGGGKSMCYALLQ